MSWMTWVSLTPLRFEEVCAGHFPPHEGTSPRTISRPSLRSRKAAELVGRPFDADGGATLRRDRPTPEAPLPQRNLNRFSQHFRVAPYPRADAMQATCQNPDDLMMKSESDATHCGRIGDSFRSDRGGALVADREARVVTARGNSRRRSRASQVIAQRWSGRVLPEGNRCGRYSRSS